MSQRPYRGVFPVVPTIFNADGTLDLPGQRRCVDFMIDAGSNGLCILANFSEQFALADDERELLTREILGHVAGRVPVIVTTTHFSSAVCAARSRRAQELGAAMVMVMPPYHGATLRVGEKQVAEFFHTVCGAITLWADLEAGCTGAMTGGGFPDGMRRIVDPYLAGRRDEAFDSYQRWLPLINWENRQAGFLAAKALMEAGGVIRCGAPRHPWPALAQPVRDGLIDIARRLDPLVLRWGR